MSAFYRSAWRLLCAGYAGCPSLGRAREAVPSSISSVNAPHRPCRIDRR